jgi:hypothetical protein
MRLLQVAITITYYNVFVVAPAIKTESPSPELQNDADQSETKITDGKMADLISLFKKNRWNFLSVVTH